NGDAAPADGVWSLEISGPVDAPAGMKALEYRIRDRDGFGYIGVLNLAVTNSPPQFAVAGSTLENADSFSGSTFGPAETMQFRIAVEDPDGPTGQMTVTADLSGAFGGQADEPLS